MAKFVVQFLINNIQVNHVEEGESADDIKHHYGQLLDDKESEFIEIAEAVIRTNAISMFQVAPYQEKENENVQSVES